MVKVEIKNNEKLLSEFMKRWGKDVEKNEKNKMLLNVPWDDMESWIHDHADKFLCVYQVDGEGALYVEDDCICSPLAFNKSVTDGEFFFDTFSEAVKKESFYFPKVSVQFYGKKWMDMVSWAESRVEAGAIANKKNLEMELRTRMEVMLYADHMNDVIMEGN